MKKLASLAAALVFGTAAFAGVDEVKTDKKDKAACCAKDKEAKGACCAKDKKADEGAKKG